MPQRSGLPLSCLALLTCVACNPQLEATVKTNPICDISSVVSWTTKDPASSWVEVGQGAEPSFRVGSDALVTDHEVVVVGMVADSSYQLEAVSVTDSGKELRAEPAVFETGSLPDPWLQGEIAIPDAAAVQAGWTIANVMNASLTPITVVILDEQGQVVWYFADDDENAGADIQVSWFHDRGEMLIGPHVAPGDHSFQMDLQGNVSWEGPEQPGDFNLINLQQGQWHHVLTELDNGDHVTVQSNYEYVGDDEIQGDRVIQLDTDNNEVWSWNTFDHLEYDPDDLYMGLWWTHLNSVVVDSDEDVAYINSWVLGHTFKVDRASGEILWTLGLGGDFAPDPDAMEPWYQKSHSFEPIGDDHYVIYDNGDSSRGWSRIMEYALDESTMQAEIVWQYPEYGEEDVWWVISCGDVDLLDNGNHLVVADHRIMELTVEGEIVWEYTWIPGESIHDTRSYQAERIPALVEAL